MKNRSNSCETGPSKDLDKQPKLWLAIAVCGLVAALLGIVRWQTRDDSPVSMAELQTRMPGGTNSRSNGAASVRSFTHHPVLDSTATAEQKVAAKLAEFARSRLNLARALAVRRNVEMPAEVEQFFAAVESGDWNEIDATFKKINGGDSSAGHSDGRSPVVAELWPAVIDAYGAAEQVHEWPAQKLLDYGNAVLGALRPGMVYVGGTDNGRWIPELLNDTSDGEHHIILTQNALADNSYLDYLKLQYDRQLANLSEEDSTLAFKEYIADAEKRLRHDQEHPDEPKQIRPGEDVRFEDSKIQVSGQVAVMGINEKLLQTLMLKNPDLSFAIQESFPLRGTYADALPLGPLMELRAADGANSFTQERATASLNYWRSTAQQVLADPDSSSSDNALKSYSHDAVAAANLLAARGFLSEAEQGYRVGSQLFPANPESTYALANLLAQGGRENEARQLLDEFSTKYPDQRAAMERLSGAWRATATRASGP